MAGRSNHAHCIVVFLTQRISHVTSFQSTTTTTTTTLLCISQIGGMCMSEPNAGTDVLGMKSNALYDPARDGFILNGTKVRPHSMNALVQRLGVVPIQSHLTPLPLY